MKNTKRIIISSLLLSLVAPAFAEAQANRKNAESAVAAPKVKTVGDLLNEASKKNEKKATEILPKANLGFSAPASNVNLESVKPPKTAIFAQQDSSARAQYEKVLDQQIRQLYGMTQKHKKSPNRGELWLRLAELYVEKATVIESRKQDEYDAKLKAFQEGKSKVKPKLNLAEAREYNRKSIQLYEWFTKDFPKDNKIPQALFFLGFNYYELGDTKKGTEYYNQLIKQYPRSEFVGEAQFALGEHYFENDQWDAAYKAYTPLIKNKRHRMYSFALYKSAWCLFRTGKSERALQYLEHIVRSSKNNKNTKGNENNARLENEAIRDMVVFYMEAGKPEQAPAYFRSLVGKEKADVYLERLAYGYSDKGNKDASREIFKYLIKNYPTSPKAFEYQYQIVQNYFYIKDSQKFKAELYNWIKDYDKTSAWSNANQKDKALIEKAYKLRETTLRNYVLQQHQTAQNSRAQFSQSQALDAYSIYLKEFSDSEFGGDMRFYYGELLYDMGKFEMAGVQYKWVVDNAPKSKFYDKAAQNLMIAVQRSIPSDQELQKKLGSSTDPIEFDSNIQKFVAVATWYTAKFPNTEKAVEVKFRLARLYYQYNQFDTAIKEFKGIVAKYPKTKYAEFSANLLLDIYNIKKDYVGLEKTGAELLLVPEIAASKTGDDIRGIIEQASFKRGQDLEGQKKFAESAKAYETFAIGNKKSKLSTTAYFNAAINYERAGMQGKAIENYQIVLNSSAPEAALHKPKIPRLLAKLYQDTNQFEQAARYYKIAAQENPKDPLAPNFIFNAAILYEALGSSKEALSSYNEFIRVNKKASDNLEAVVSMAQIHRKNGQISPAVQRYMEYVEGGGRSQEKVVESAYWVTVMSRKVNAITRSKEWKQKTLSIQKRFAPARKGVGAKYAAELRLEDAEVTFKEMKAIKFPANPARQKEAADRKINLMTKLSGELTEVIKYDSAEEIVKSLAILGEANQNMSQTIISAPLPAGLNPEETKQYKEGVAKFAEPFDIKAKESFKTAVDRGFELETYNVGFKTAYAYMRNVDPKNYYDGGEKGSETRLVNWMGE